MTDMDDEQEPIRQCLTAATTIAIVGLSVHAERPSHGVAAYLQRQGYRIVPVNPAYAGSEILGEICYPSLAAAAAALKSERKSIDIVDLFRKSAEVGAAIDDAITLGAPCVWLQLEVHDTAAVERAERAGLLVVTDKCIKIEHMQLFS
jgi:predicted CoA-binding protein